MRSLLSQRLAEILSPLEPKKPTRRLLKYEIKRRPSLDQVICCDCVEGMKKLPNDCIDLTVSSPPYGSLRTYQGFSFDFTATAEQLFRVTKPGGVVVWITNDETVKGDESGESFRQALGFKDVGFRLHDTMLYSKAGVKFPESTRYYPAFEYMFVLSKGRPKTVDLLRDRPNLFPGKRNAEFKRSRNGSFVPRCNTGPYEVKAKGVRRNIWVYGTGTGQTAPDELWKQHPAVFPLQLAKDHISTWSKPGDLVLDVFAGSGQTLIAAAQLNRRFLGFDCSPEYCELARERLRWFGLYGEAA